MDWGVLGLIALVIGIVACIVQVLDYLEKRRRKPQELPLPLPPRPKIPHNLPQPGEFIGREREKAEVRKALASRSYLICIDGIGGIGKTALALKVAHDCLKASKGELPADGIPTFDAFVWTTAKDRELALSDILDTIARTLDYPYIAQLPPEEKPPETAKLLRQYKCLLIVDNFETITDDAVRDFLLNLPEPSKALITSRYQKLRQARAVSLRGMEQDEALALIRSEGRRLGLSAVENAEERVLLRLYEATGGAPLAIKWAVGQMKQRGQSLDTVLDYLYEARGDVFENIFARSWSLLSENAKRVLMVMPIFATSASKPAIEAASDVHKWDLDEALGQLVEMWLVEASEELDEAKRRYSIHPLTRAFAGARLGDDKGWEREARLRSVTYLLEFAGRYGGKDWDNWLGYEKLEDERENIFAAMEWSRVTDQRKLLVDFVEAIKDFLYIYGYWDDYMVWSQQAIQAAKQERDKAAEARALKDIGWILCLRGDYERAQEVLERALAIAQGIGDKRKIADILGRFGQIPHRKGNYNEARKLQERALNLALEIGDQRQAVVSRYWLGRIAYDQGEYEEARKILKQVLVQGREINWQRLVAYTLGCLGDIARRQNELREAQVSYDEALSILRRFRDKRNIAEIKQSQALLEEGLGDFGKALKLARDAYDTFERLGLEKEVVETRELVERLEAKITEARK